MTDKFRKFMLTEASAAQALDRGNELHDLLMNSDALKKLKEAGMKTQKKRQNFMQAIKLLKG